MKSIAIAVVLLAGAVVLLAGLLFGQSAARPQVSIASVHMAKDVLRASDFVQPDGSVPQCAGRSDDSPLCMVPYVQRWDDGALVLTVQGKAVVSRIEVEEPDPQTCPTCTKRREVWHK